MRNKISMSIAAASVVALSMFTGCTSSNGTVAESAPIPNLVSVATTGSDGYIVKIQNTPATALCTNVDTTQANATWTTKTFKSKTDINITNGVVPFDLDNANFTCRFTMPADAILDSNGNGIYDSADTRELGFTMTSLSGSFTTSPTETPEYPVFLTTPITNYVIALQDAGKDVDSDFLKLATSFDPVLAISALTDTTDTAAYAQAVQLTAFNRSIVTLQQTIPSALALTQLSTTQLLKDITANKTDVNTTEIFKNVDGNTTTLKNVVVSELKIIATLPDIAASTDNTVDITQLFVSTIDSKKSFKDALNESTSGSDFDFTNATVLETTVTSTTTEQASTKVANDTFEGNLPAFLNLGNTLTLGTLTVALSTTGEFNTTVTVTDASSLVDFSKIILPSATLSKGYSVTQNIYLEATVTNQADANDVVTLTFGTSMYPMQIKPNDANTSVTITVPANTPATITDVQNGIEVASYTNNATETKTNTDLSFDACTAIGGCDVSGIDDLNAYLIQKDKNYNVLINIYGLDTNSTTSDLVVDYTTIRGTVSVQ